MHYGQSVFTNRTYSIQLITTLHLTQIYNDFHSGCQNIGLHYQQQSFSEQPSPEQSDYIKSIWWVRGGWFTKKKFLFYQQQQANKTCCFFTALALTWDAQWKSLLWHWFTYKCKIIHCTTTWPAIKHRKPTISYFML